MLDGVLQFAAECLVVVAANVFLAHYARIQHQNITFQQPRQEARFALGAVLVYTVLLLVIHLLRANPLTPSAPPPQAGQGYTSDHVSTQLYVALLSFVFLAAALLLRGQGFETIRLSRHNLGKSLLYGLLLGLTSVVIWGKRLDSSADVYLLALMLLVGVTEEAVFRGYLQTRLSAWQGARRGWVVTALLFALWHLPQRILIQRQGVGLLAAEFVALFVLGLWFGWLADRTENIAAPSLFHALHNWAVL